jgi:putative photosynthetic complex assembly protein
MSANAEVQQIPKGALIAAAFLMAWSILFAFVATKTDFGATRLDPAAPVQSLSLQFNDLADGSIGIYDAAKKRDIEILPPGKNGFVRVVMRGMAQGRAVNGVGAEVPFTLSKLEDGRLVLIDPTSNRIVTLEAFGFNNLASFQDLFNKGSQQQ